MGDYADDYIESGLNTYIDEMFDSPEFYEEEELDGQVISIQAKKPIKCPICHSALKERTNSITGDKFMGCTKFPRCKYTHAIE